MVSARVFLSTLLVTVLIFACLFSGGSALVASHLGPVLGLFFPFGFVSFFLFFCFQYGVRLHEHFCRSCARSHHLAREAAGVVVLEEVVDCNKLSAVQFIPRGLIRLTFKEVAEKERLVSQGSIMLENVECDVTPSDRPYTMVYVDHYPAEGDDALLLEQFRRFGKIVATKQQHFPGRPNLLTDSRVLTMSLLQQIPAEVFVDSYPTQVWYRGMAPFCLFWPVLPPWSFMWSTLCAMGFGPSFIVVEDVVVEKEVADEDSVEDDEDAVVEDEGGERGVRRDITCPKNLSYNVLGP